MKSKQKQKYELMSKPLKELTETEAKTLERMLGTDLLISKLGFVAGPSATATGIYLLCDGLLKQNNDYIAISWIGITMGVIAIILNAKWYPEVKKQYKKVKDYSETYRKRE